MLESEIEKKLRDEIKKIGGKAYKFVSPGSAGVPDRIVILPGNKIGFAELKRPGEKPRPLQKMQIKKLRDLGAFVMVVDSEEKIKEFIEELANEIYRT